MPKADKPANIFNLHKVLLQGGSQSFPLFRNFAKVMFVGCSRALEDIEEELVSNMNQTILVPRVIRLLYKASENVPGFINYRVEKSRPGKR